MKIPKLSKVKKDAVHYKPWLKHEPLFRHVVTVYVDTFERSAEAVMSTVQAALDEHTNTTQPEEVVTFEAATAVGATRTESTQSNGPAKNGGNG